MPLVSGAATSAALDQNPSFARTIPTNAADARAIMVYFHSIGVTHCANLFSQDAWGRTYNTDLQREANKLGINMISFGYQIDQDDIVATLQRLKQSAMRYIYAIIKFDWQFIVETAYDLGIIGTDQHVWIGAEATDWTDDGLELSRSSNSSSKLAQALNGVGSLSLHVEDHQPLDDAMKDFLENPQLQQEYVEAHPEAFIFDNYSFAESVNPSASFYHQMFYDATYSIGLAACNTPGLFTGPELYETLVNLEFEGVTGRVRFDPVTGTRSPDSVRFRIDNVFLSNNRSDANYTRFESELSAIIVNGQVEHAHRFIYHDNSTHAPPSIPILEHDYHLIPIGAQVFGWIAGALIMLLSLAIISWTWYYRNTFVVRASQPIFLFQICLGTLVLAAAIIPLGMQGREESVGLDVACMASIWMIFLGFAIALSALFSRTWRMNQVMQSGIEMKRIEVKVIDVIWPLVILMVLNVTLLIGWTVVSPFSYIRADLNDYDKHGRSLESQGRCMSESNTFLYFFIPLVLVDFIGVVTAFYQSYVARKLPTEFSESYYLLLSMGCLMETLALGGPIVFAASTAPTAFFMVLASLICMACLTILLPVFVPKYMNRHAKSQSVLRSTVVAARSARISRSSVSVRGRMTVTRRSTARNSATQSHRQNVAFTLQPGPSGGHRVTFAQAAAPAESSHALHISTQNPSTTRSWGGIDLRDVSDASELSSASPPVASNRQSSSDFGRSSDGDGSFPPEDEPVDYS